MKPPLIGAAGIEYIATQLATRGPPAINEIQERCGLRPLLCKPAIGMLDHLGISRAEVHRYLLHRAMKELLDRIPMMSTEQLEALLEASFPYLGIKELRSIPIRVMERIQLVPPNYLKLLAEDKAIFQHLPPKVQQEVWEFDQNLLQLDAMPLVASYKYEVATVQQTIKMDEFITWAQMADYEERRAEDDSAAQGVQRKVGNAAASGGAAQLPAASNDRNRAWHRPVPFCSVIHRLLHCSVKHAPAAPAHTCQAYQHMCLRCTGTSILQNAASCCMHASIATSSLITHPDTPAPTRARSRARCCARAARPSRRSAPWWAPARPSTCASRTSSRAGTGTASRCTLAPRSSACASSGRRWGAGARCGAVTCLAVVLPHNQSGVCPGVRLAGC
jgi:hypothetical protein